MVILLNIVQIRNLLIISYFSQFVKKIVVKKQVKWQIIFIKFIKLSIQLKMKSLNKTTINIKFRNLVQITG